MGPEEAAVTWHTVREPGDQGAGWGRGWEATRPHPSQASCLGAVHSQDHFPHTRSCHQEGAGHQLREGSSCPRSPPNKAAQP